MVRLAPLRAFGMASLLPLAAAAPGAGAERTIAPGQLEAALAEATPGETLRLGPGIHAGAFTVRVPVQLVGEPGAVVQGLGRGGVLTLAAPGIRVRNLTVRGGGSDLSEDDAVVRIAQVEDVAVEGCRIEARAFGIYLEGGRGHRIAGNEVRGDPSLPVARRGNGIHLWHSVRNEVRDNHLVDVRDGIYLSFAHDNLIEGNRGRALRYGIHYMYSERNTLEGNLFARCRGGIALMFSMRNRIEANEALENAQFGILCQQLERSELVRNRVAGNGRGFYIQNSAANRLVANVMADNGVGAYLTAGSEGNVFTANRFAGNLVQVFDDGPGANAFSETGRGNYWSDYAGFDWNADGVGETPYRLQTPASALMAHRPVTRWFYMSPVLALLEWWGAWEAGLMPPDPRALDLHPLLDE